MRKMDLPYGTEKQWDMALFITRVYPFVYEGTTEAELEEFIKKNYGEAHNKWYWDSRLEQRKKYFCRTLNDDNTWVYTDVDTWMAWVDSQDTVSDYERIGLLKAE